MPIDLNCRQKLNSLVIISTWCPSRASASDILSQRMMDMSTGGRRADYILALKGNQGTLCHDAELFAVEQKANDFKDATISRHKTGHGDLYRVP